MKKNLLLLLILLSGAATYATGIGADYALQVAQNYYTRVTGNTARLVLAYESVSTSANTGLPAGTPLYYAFNADGGQGFVLIAADDVVSPILGYSNQGSFKITNAPPVITDWLNKYNKKIAYAKLNVTKQANTTAMTWNGLYYNISNAPASEKQLRASNAVNPLVTTTWDQDLYYNAQCPADANAPYGYGGNVPTGCGATAMSQIMRYWSYPAQGSGNNSYNSNYGPLSANFAATAYNWANMPNSVTSPNNDVATIMYDCGVAVDMNYSTNESTSYLLSGGGVPASCQAAYTTYFGYDPNTIQGLQRANYADADWLNLIQTELNNNRPIQYAGQGPDGGHTFVLDGSDGNGNFHINWGWSGDDNGYYNINALTPSPDANGDFSQDEQMVIGIQPPNVTPVASGIALAEATTVNPNPITFDQTFTVTTNVVNQGSSAFNGDFCAALFDASGNFIRYIGAVLSTSGTPLAAGNEYTNGLTFQDTASGPTAPGTYTIGIYYAPTGASNWTLAGLNGYTNPITVTISGPTNTNISLYSSITASPTVFVQGQPASVNVNLINNGTTTFLGTYEAVLLDLQGNFVEQIGSYTESTGIPAGDYYLSPYITFSSNSINSPEGEYLLAIAEEQSGTSNWYYCGGQSYTNPVLIYVVNNGFSVGINQTTASTLKVYPNPSSGVVNVDAGELRGNYTMKIINALGQMVTESNGVLNGQVLTADVSKFATGMYVVQLKTENGTITSKLIVK